MIYREPEWTTKLKTYLNQPSPTHLLMLTGNIDDLVYTGFERGPENFVSFLCFFFRDSFSLILYFDPSTSLKVRYDSDNYWNKLRKKKPDSKNQAEERYQRMAHSTNRMNAVEILRRLTPVLQQGDVRVLFIVNHFDIVCPKQRLTPNDRVVFATVQNWIHDELIMDSGNLVLLLTKRRSDIPDDLSENIRILEIPSPSCKVQKEFLKDLFHQKISGQVKWKYSEDDILQLEKVFRRYQISLARLRGVFLEALDEGVKFDAAFLRKQLSGAERSFEDLTDEEILKLPRLLKEQVIGQDEAVEKVCAALKRHKAGLRDESKPIGVFMSLGPTGVGKTELVKATAREIFGSEENMIRLDMSEYKEKHAVAKITGAPPGYIGHDRGGTLTEQVAVLAEGIIILDEFEKAHVEVHDLWLQVFDDGRLTDGKGKTFRFDQFIIFCTSNLGAREAQKAGSYREMRACLEQAVKQTLRPELINRFDDILVFRPLSEESCRKIVQIKLEKLTERLKRQGIEIEFGPNTVEFLLEEGFDPEYGARPLERAIDTYLIDQLAEAKLRGTLTETEVNRIDVEGNSLQIIQKRSWL